MKSNKLMSIIQVILMYVAHIPIYLGLLFFLTDTCTESVLILFLVGIILTGLILPFCLASAIVSILSIFRKPSNPTKAVFISKLALIPWFIGNFYFCVLMLAGLLNPFLLILAPIVFVIEVSITYLLMITISIIDLAFIINKLKAKEIVISKYLVFINILLFIFCLDFIGSLLIYLKMLAKSFFRASFSF